MSFWVTGQLKGLALPARVRCAGRLREETPQAAGRSGGGGEGEGRGPLACAGKGCSEKVPLEVTNSVFKAGKGERALRG